MNKVLLAASAAVALITSCNMENPLLTESTQPFGAPEFDKIKIEHYMPAFEVGIEEGKKEIDAIVSNEEEPTFENTIEALEVSGQTLDRVAGVFYNILSSNTSDELQALAQQVSPLMTEFSLYTALNKELFERVKVVYDNKENLDLAYDQAKLLEDTYKSFSRNGANLSEEDKALYSKYSEELSLLTLKFGDNTLAATNAYTLHIADSADLVGLPAFVVDMSASTAKEKGLEGWAFTLDYPSYIPFLKYSENRELRKQIWTASNTKAIGGDFDNTENVKKIVELRIKIANLLGYKTHADYVLEERMAKSSTIVDNFIADLLYPSVPFAKEEVAEIVAYAKDNGFKGELMPWDFSFWSEKFKAATYSIDDQQLKPYFQLENCIEAVFDLANTLYGITFKKLDDVSVYHPDVEVYEVLDENGKHLALYYADYFPRASKQGGAWMTEFRGQSIVNGVEKRPFVSIVTNFTKPTETSPSLITHSELVTLLHEFGHALHGILAQGRYSSLTGTNVSRDFVELPSQLMENWAYEPEFLNTFAKHYQTSEIIPMDLITKIVDAKNFLAAYGQVRQLHFASIDMKWHSLTDVDNIDVVEFEESIIAPTSTLPTVAGTALSPSFGHIFSGGYSAGYYSYKWAEVLEADAFSLFKEKGIFNKEVATSFKENILSKGGAEDESVIFERFRGRSPRPEALMEKLGLTTK